MSRWGPHRRENHLGQADGSQFKSGEAGFLRGLLRGSQAWIQDIAPPVALSRLADSVIAVRSSGVDLAARIQRIDCPGSCRRELE